jgi:outer membrane protein TolC
MVFNANTFAPGIPPNTTEITTYEQDYYGLSLTVQQPLFTGGNLTYSYQRAQGRTNEQDHLVARQRKILRLEVKKSFFEALNGYVSIRTAEKILGAKQERLRVLTELHREGYVEKEDLLRQEADLLFAEVDLAKRRNDMELSLSRLRTLMEYPDNEPLAITGAPHKGTVRISLEEVKKAGLERRDDLKAATTRLHTAELDVDLARSSFYPQLSVQGSYMLQNETNIAQTNTLMLSVLLDWPLFEWGRTKAEVAKESANRSRIQYDRQELERKISVDIERGWRSLKDRELAISAWEKQVQVDVYGMGIIIQKYAEGKKKLADVIDVEAELLKNYGEYLRSAYEFNLALAELEAASSLNLDDRVTMEKLYEPDFEGFARQFQEIRDRKSSRK